MSQDENEINRRLSKIQTSSTVSTFLAAIAFVAYSIVFQFWITPTPKLDWFSDIVYAGLILATGLSGILSSFIYHLAARELEKGISPRAIESEKIADYLLWISYLLSAGILAFFSAVSPYPIPLGVIIFASGIILVIIFVIVRKA